MDKVLIAVIVALGVVACERGTSPNSPNPIGRHSAQNPSAAPTQPRDSQVDELSFESFDTNKDGVITPNEALAAPGLDFASADTDNSHAVTRQEFAAAMARSRPGG